MEWLYYRFLPLVNAICGCSRSKLFLSKRECEGRYEIVQVLKERQVDENWGRITRAHFFQGLREGTFIFVISVYVYLASGSELALGKYSLVNLQYHLYAII